MGPVTIQAWSPAGLHGRILDHRSSPSLPGNRVGLHRNHSLDSPCRLAAMRGVRLSRTTNRNCPEVKISRGTGSSSLAVSRRYSGFLLIVANAEIRARKLPSVMLFSDGTGMPAMPPTSSNPAWKALRRWHRSNVGCPSNARLPAVWTMVRQLESPRVRGISGQSLQSSMCWDKSRQSGRISINLSMGGEWLEGGWGGSDLAEWKWRIHRHFYHPAINQ